MKSQNWSEKTLVYKVVTSKDPDAFAALYDQYVDALFRFVYFKVGNKDVAEDLTSDVFLKVWHYLIDTNKRREVRQFRALLYRIARNRVIDFYRERARNQEQPLEYVIGFVWGEDLQAKIEAKHEVEKVLKHLKKLKHEYQEVIVLKYLEGFSSKQIAQILDKKPATIRVVLYRALKKLKELAKDHA